MWTQFEGVENNLGTVNAQNMDFGNLDINLPFLASELSQVGNEDQTQQETCIF
jgi:hypothetical protein